MGLGIPERFIKREFRDGSGLCSDTDHVGARDRVIVNPYARPIKVSMDDLRERLRDRTEEKLRVLYEY